MSEPKRIQRKRTKGWKMPPNTVSVTRPGRFGNPFRIEAAIETGFEQNKEDAQSFVVDCFREWITGGPHGRDWWQGPESDAAKTAILNGLSELRGKNLACYCKIGEPCHADVLLELANAHHHTQETDHE